MNKFQLLVLSVIVLTLVACATKETKPIDTHFSGAYQFEDGTLVSIGPSNDKRMRMIRYEDGQPFSLYHNQDEGFDVSSGFNSEDFFAAGNFQYDSNGEIVSADWQEDNYQKQLKRLPLIRKQIMFKSGELTLRGELTLPAGDGPFPVVITIHGSESYSAVDYYQWPYMLAANGIAGFKFDKRGTGGSEGEYTQNFPTLAGDVIAAIKRLEQENTIDISRTNLLGFSQGGWIAPLVAKQVDIQSYIIGFGTTVPTPREDRWGYVKRLLDNGFGEEEIAKADQFNEIITKIVFEHDESSWDDLIALKEAHEDEEWFHTIAGSDSVLGIVASKLTHPLASIMPNFGWKLYTKWKRGDDNGPSFNHTYQPLETLESLNTPSLWLMAGEDTSLPTPETVKDLSTLKAKGLPVDYVIYEGAEHGNVVYTTDESGNRTYTNYANTYFKDVVEYFKAQNLDTENN
ncbi:alpha/beta hydrolase [Alteromonadaceae bacterium M269]|nr:alpha/beta hydrolase [Alteromonadaceae bacterium M269]